MSWRDTGRSLRRHLIAGLIVIAPLGATIFVLYHIFIWLDGILGSFLYAAIGRSIPGLGLLALLVLLLAVGWVAERAIGARVINTWNAWLERVPLARRVYSASNRIVRAIFGGTRSFFREVVLVEYPSDGRWSIGFLAGPAPGTMTRQVGETVTVFVPTTPNPTSGWLVVVPRERVVPLDMTLEEAFTYILSAGVVTPVEAPVPAPPAAMEHVRSASAT
jgi:uncharacterized membrane protein